MDKTRTTGTNLGKRAKPPVLLTQATARAQSSHERAQAYKEVKKLLRMWASYPVTNDEDAEAVEDCKKICSLMGWKPEVL